MSQVKSKINKQNIEDIYELSPMQQGMLFETLYAPESGVYVTQLCLTLDGTLNVSAFQQAWQAVVDQHPILRTLFIWQRDKAPLQMVRKQVTLPWTSLDWQGHGDVEATLNAWLQADRQQGFPLDQAPLMRSTLIRTRDSWRFVWTQHHLIGDGWSLPLLWQELWTRYRAACAGQWLVLPSPRPYRDYILWLRRQERQRAEAFWREQLQGFNAPTPFGVDQRMHTRATDAASMANQHYTLPKELSAALITLAQTQQLTLNTLVQGAWALLLGRYSGNREVLFGATVSGRPPTLGGVERMVGLFINTLPVAVALPPEQPVLPWLQALQQTQITAQEYAYLSLTDLQSVSSVPHGTPLFESILVFENYPEDSEQDTSFSGMVQAMHSHEQTNYPLTIAVIPGAELSFTFSYDTRRFDTATIERMAGHFQTLLAGIVADPNLRLSQLPLLTEAERHQILVDWNNTETDYPFDACIHHLFEQQVTRTPDAVAVVYARRDKEQQLTYHELNTRANQLAHHLISLGVGPEVLVGICVERSLEMVVGLLAILKAGGAYVPLDPTYPTERLAFMLQDASLPVLLTQQHLASNLPPTSAQVVCLDNDWSTTAPPSDQNLECKASSTNLAYVLYTSGSTGRPKGVAMQHDALVNLLQWQAQQTKISTPRTVQFAPISFDVSFQEIFSTWCVGGTLYLFDEQTRRDPAALLRFLSEHQNQRLFLPFVALQQLTSIAKIKSGFLPHLREVITAGEQLHITPAIAKFFTQLPHCTFWNHYGPTEAHVVSTFELPVDPEQWSQFPSIGKPVANTQLYILDNHQQATPIGVFGELYIGGIQLAREYVNQPDLTLEKFIANPFAPQGNPGRLYRTGDLARWLPDGNIEFLGRTDHQVKIRGFRIELGEIEAVLTQHPEVQEAVVIAREDEPGQKRLVAYVVGRKGDSTTALRDHLLMKLPDYMLPSAFVALEALPLTPNGKVDRQTLPAPVLHKEPTPASRPRTLAEQQLVQIWEETLNVHPIGIHDNFFELGGHSLLAVQLLAKLHQTFGQQLPLRTLFQNPTVAALAQALQQSDNSTSSVVALQPRGTRPPFFCLPGAGGGVLYLYSLVRAMGNEQPFYALESVGLDGKTPPYTTVEAAAAYQVKELQRHQPNGPYYLGGHSFGGFVAFEMAQQLLNRGTSVGAVVILDTGAPTGKSSPMEEVEIILLYERLFLEEYGLNPTLTEEQLTPLTSFERLSVFKKSLEDVGFFPPNSPLDQIRGIVNVVSADLQAIDYLPTESTSLPIHLFVATDDERDEASPKLTLARTQTMIDGWSKYGEVRVHEVPGTHTTMMYEPHVQVLAQKLVSCLNDDQMSER